MLIGQIYSKLREERRAFLAQRGQKEQKVDS